MYHRTCNLWHLYFQNNDAQPFRSVIMTPKVTWHNIQNHTIELNTLVTFVSRKIIVQKPCTCFNVFYLSRYWFPTISLSVTLGCKVKQKSYTVENMIFRFCDPKIHILDTATSFVWLLVFEISMTDNLGAWPMPTRSRDNWGMIWIGFLDSLTPKTLY